MVSIKVIITTLLYFALVTKNKKPSIVLGENRLFKGNSYLCLLDNYAKLTKLSLNTN